MGAVRSNAYDPASDRRGGSTRAMKLLRNGTRRERPKSLLMTFARVSGPTLRPNDLGDAQRGPSVVIFVRHGRPLVQPRVPSYEWPLDPTHAGLVENLGAALPGLQIVCSDMRRAIETARYFGEPTIDERLREVAQPRLGELDDELERYLRGERLDGWERQHQAHARVQAAVHDHGDAIYVSHGTVLSLYLASVVPKLSASRFWRGFRYPDTWKLDGNDLVRISTNS